MKERLIEAFKKAIIEGNTKWRNNNEIHTNTNNKSDIGITIKQFNSGIAGIYVNPSYYIKDYTQNKEYKIEKSLYDELEVIFNQNYEI